MLSPPARFRDLTSMKSAQGYASRIELTNKLWAGIQGGGVPIIFTDRTHGQSRWRWI